jgi:hypothetical protein
MKRFFFAVIMFSSASTAFGYDYDLALDKHAQEMATCAAYFTVVYQVLKTSTDKNDAERAEKFREQMNEAVKYSLLMSSEKITAARTDKAIKEMIRKTDNNPVANMSVLYNEYGFLCMDVIDNPFKRLKYWLDMK